ncbi:hypothetical protein I8J29_14085 [Paenibacillus sp. MWE-103]|uniref:Uncharacterized protein n=1 Tax=Paenibacillus artemisiicola TaxID=1172618 RepID=A0ABS3WAK0_9BACL|nr:hypothetical protein [Paenibacillus artemisiicola]MBO7745337.1 hypothetical protein [Paenibacillus artemisiicola]
MPLFVPTNMQGASSSDEVTIPLGEDPFVVLEWGHLIESETSLLFAQGKIELQAFSTDGPVTFSYVLMVDGVIIDIAESSATTPLILPIGARQEDLPAEHLVFQVLVTGEGAGSLVVGNRECMTISGPAIL